MSDDTERLIVMLEARVRDFEKNMQKASGTADRSYDRMRRSSRSATRQMEADMSRSTRRINQLLVSTSTQVGVLGRSFVAGFAGGIFAGGATGLVGGVRSIVSELSEMGKQMDRVGLSAKVFQEVQFGFELAGVAQSDFITGMEQFTKRIGEASMGSGRLHDILEANGVAIRDQNGEIKSSEQLLRDYADLIRNAGSEQEKMTLATEAFGRGGASFVNALQNGAEGLDEMARATEEAGGTIDEHLIRKAEELDDRWATAWRNFEINGKSAIMSVVTYLDSLAARMGEIGNSSIFRWLSEQAGTSGAIFVPGQGVFTPGSDEMTPDARIASAFTDAVGGALSEADAKLVEALKKRYGAAAETAKKTVLPDAGGGDGGKGGKRNQAADAALREAEAVNRLIDGLAHELSLIGQSELEQDKLNARRQAGAAATEQQLAQIDMLIEAIHRETEANRQAEQAAEARADALDNLFGMASDGLMAIADGSENAEDAIRKLIIQLALAAVQGALLGSGPLAGLFGGGFTAGAGGGFRALIGYSSGTANTGGQRGEPRGIVHGQEAVIPLPAGGQVPVVLSGRGAVGQNAETRVKVDVGVSVDNNGNLSAFVRRVSQESAASTLSDGLRHYNQDVLPSRVNQIVSDRRVTG